MKNYIKKLNEIYNRFEDWFEKQFGCFFTNAEKAEFERNTSQK